MTGQAPLMQAASGRPKPPDLPGQQASASRPSRPGRTPPVFPAPAQAPGDSGNPGILRCQLPRTLLTLPLPA